MIKTRKLLGILVAFLIAFNCMDLINIQAALVSADTLLNIAGEFNVDVDTSGGEPDLRTLNETAFIVIDKVPVKGDTVSVTADFEGQSGNPVLFVIVYSNNGRVIASAYKNADDANEEIELSVTIPEYKGELLLKAFLWDSLANMRPVTRAISARVEEREGKPETPAGLRAYNQSGKVLLMWDRTDTAESYDVYISTDGHTYTLTNENTSLEMLTVTGLTGGARYYFAITAKNKNGTSGLSEQVTAVPYTAPVSAMEFTSEGGWFESIYASWDDKTAKAGDYHVYYKLSSHGESGWIRADERLVSAEYNELKTDQQERKPNEFRYTFEQNGRVGTRVDIPGLKANTAYDLKVVPVVSGTENENGAGIARGLVPKAYEREGFAFGLQAMGVSPYGSSGGYNMDGTPRNDAEIIYITEDSNMMGYNTEINDVQGKLEGNAEGALIIRIVGRVTHANMLEQLIGYRNVTVEGIGPNAVLEGVGVYVTDSSNIEIRNLTFYNYSDDGVSAKSNVSNLWVHNNNFMIGNIGRDNDQYLGDGACDITNGNTNITISYNRFIGTGKSSLCGMYDTEEFFITYDHNFFEGSGERHPRTRLASAHVYNNYYKDVYGYGVGASKKSSIFSEGNYFENVKIPYIRNGSVHGGSLMLDEMGGNIKLGRPDYMDAASLAGFSPDSKGASIGDVGLENNWGQIRTVYNDFDIDTSKMYTYIQDTPWVAKARVMAYAGIIKSEVSGMTIIPYLEQGR